MNSKYGLHKRISFIFDGASERPSDGAADSASETPKAPAAATEPRDETATAKTMTPTPVAAKTVAAKPKKKMDGRQKRALILAAVLLPVFVGVLWLSLSAPEPAGGAPSAAAQPTAAAKTPMVSVQWNKPQPWPESMRDPMQIARTTVTVGVESANAELVVRGIVLGQGRSSAIIGEQIVFEGETVRGTTVRKIDKDAVEFERDGKTWTQQVQP